MMKSKQTLQGVTLIELMIVLVVASVLLAIVVPSYQSIIANNKASSMANAFSAGLTLARSEAIKRGISVTMCALIEDNNNQCATSNDSAENWRHGWIIFTDDNGNGRFDPAQDTLVQRGGEQMTDIVMSDFPNMRVTYTSSGFLSTGSGDYTLLPEDCVGSYAGRVVNISSTGRPSVSHATCN